LNLDKLIKQDNERPKNQLAAVLGRPNSWGLNHSEAWDHLVQDEAVHFIKMLESFEESKQVCKQAMQKKSQQLSTTPRSTEDKDLNGAKDYLRDRMPLVDVDLLWLRGLLTTCAQSMSFSNVEKMFGFPIEALSKVLAKDDDGTMHYMPVMQNTEPSLLEKFNAPYKLVKARPTQKKNARHRKRLPAIVAIEEMKRHCQEISADAREISKHIPDEYSQALRAQYACGENIPDSYPEPIRRSLHDLSFTRRELHALKPSLIEQRDVVICAMTLWFEGSKETWDWGKQHIYEMPEFQKYEYMKKDIYAMCLNCNHLEKKLADFFLSHPECATTGWIAEVKETCTSGGGTKAERMAAAEERYRQFQKRVGELDVMVDQFDRICKQIEEGADDADIMKGLNELPSFRR